MADPNVLGARGEWILSLWLTEPDPANNNQPWFRPHFLGDKWPVCDLVVELEGTTGELFLVQAKATRSGINGANKLRVKVKQSTVAALCGSPIPAYIVGVDEPSWTPYIATPITPTAISSIEAKHPLRDPLVRKRLHDEVRKYWAAGTPFSGNTSAFT